MPERIDATLSWPDDYQARQGPRHDNDSCDVALSEGPIESACHDCRAHYAGESSEMGDPVG